MSRDCLLVGHRGASLEAPENTIAAFDLAKEQGAEAVECDVQLSRDGVPMIIHDPDLQRTTGVSARVCDLPAQELLRLDVGAWRGSHWRGSYIPSLAEALAWSVDGLPLIVELKNDNDPERLAAAVAATFSGSQNERVLCVSSFSATILSAIASRMPAVPRALISSDAHAAAQVRAEQARVSMLHLFWLQFRAEVPQRLPVYLWTVDDPAAAQKLASAGVRGIMTNNIDRLRGAW